MEYLTKVLDSSFGRKDFSCGKPSLDHYIHHQASQDMKRKLAVCFVSLDEENVIKGYYTLSNDTISLDGLPPELKSKLPKSYYQVPVTLLGRFAVDRKSQGTGLGKRLLIDALKRSYEVSLKSIGSMAVVIFPLDKDAQFFYQRLGFIRMPDSGKMLLPMKTIGLLFQDA